MKKWSLIVLLSSMYGCTTQTGVPKINIVLIDNGTTLKISGLNYGIMLDMAHDTTSDWQSILQVYRMPADTDMKSYQPMQKGTYKLNDSKLFFKPDTPFIKHQQYFVRYYYYYRTVDMWSFITGRRKPGRTPFIDLNFTP